MRRTALLTLPKQATALLNKLTLEKFDVLSDKIMGLLEKAAEMRMEFVQSIFEKAIDESFFSLVYAKLCRKIADAKIPDPAGGKDKDGNPATVQRIKDFRKLLLSRCQEEFEKATQADSKSNSACVTRRVTGVPAAAVPRATVAL